MGCIYKITNNVNGKSYIGMTQKDTADDRIQSHLSGNGSELLAYDIKVFGKPAFMFDILETDVSDDVIHKVENKYITEHNTSAPNGYNKTQVKDTIIEAYSTHISNENTFHTAILNNFILAQLTGRDNLSARSIYFELLFRRPPKPDVFYTQETSIKDLSETSGLKQPTVYKAITQLIAKGIIVKKYARKESEGIFYVIFDLEKQAHKQFVSEHTENHETPKPKITNETEIDTPTEPETTDEIEIDTSAYNPNDDIPF